MSEMNEIMKDERITQVYINTKVADENSGDHRIGVVPKYASDFSAGADLYLTTDCILRPGERRVLPLGFSMALDDDVEAQIRPRSGMSLKTSLRVPNSPGTIDSDYRDEVGVIVENVFGEAHLLEILRDEKKAKDFLANYHEVTYADYLKSVNSAMSEGNGQILSALPNGLSERKLFIDGNGNPAGTLYLKAGERIAQMVFAKYVKAVFVEHEDLRNIGHDRGGGFGHSGS